MVFLSICFVLPRQCNGAEQYKEQLEQSINQVIGILKDPELRKEKEKRSEMLRNAAEGTFDWKEMAKRTLGYHWRSLSSRQRTQFTETFTDFLEKNYMDKIDSFFTKNNDFSADNVHYVNTIQDGRYALVETKIVLDEGEFPIQYKMINKNGNWVVYDITIEGVGLVANYRTQFNDILSRSSFDELMKKLKEKKQIEHADPGVK